MYDSSNGGLYPQSQYTFLHDVILEAIMCGDTSLGAPVQNIVERLHELATVDQETNETLFQKQFKVLLLTNLTAIYYTCVHTDA